MFINIFKMNQDNHKLIHSGTQFGTLKLEIIYPTTFLVQT